jgi:hypothetical protein
MSLVAADVVAGLRYEAEGMGGVSIGAVTGIDASGRRVAGTLRGDEWHLEYVLPAEFVDRATYPLVLDPLFGSTQQVGNAGTGADDVPDVAFDAATLRYCVVWRVAVSSTSAEIRAQLVSFTGALLGGQMLLATDATPSMKPHVVNINATDRFLVGYGRTSFFVPTVPSRELWCRSIEAATGSLSIALKIHGNPGGVPTQPVTDFAMGGDSRVGVFGAAENALVAYRRSPSGTVNYDDIWLVRVHVPAAGDPTLVGSATTLVVGASSTYLSQLAITRHAGSAGRWLVAWCTNFTGVGAANVQVNGRFVDGVGNLCGSATTVVNATDVQDPAVATSNGVSFAVVWRDNTTARLRARPLTSSGPCSTPSLLVGAIVDPVENSGACSSPAIDFAQNKYVLAFRQQDPLLQTRLQVKSLDLDSCASCSASYVVEPAAFVQNNPAVAAQWSGAVSQGDTALVVWEFSGSIRARRYEATGAGAIANLGGQCAGPGNVNGYLGEPVLGNQSFAFTITSPSALVLALIVGLSQAPLPCGPCTLVPSMDVLLGGATSVALPIPCDSSLLGAELFTQWLLFQPGGCAIVPEIALSNAMRYTISD